MLHLHRSVMGPGRCWWVWGPSCPYRACLTPWFQWDLSPVLAEAVVPPGSPCRKDQHSLSNVNHDVIQMCLKYRLMPCGQDFDTCGAGRRVGLVGITGIHLSLSHLVFCFSLCWTQMWSLRSPLALLRAGVKAAVVATGKVWRMLEVSGCFLHGGLAGTLGVTWQLFFLPLIILALISVLEGKVWVPGALHSPVGAEIF